MFLSISTEWLASLISCNLISNYKILSNFKTFNLAHNKINNKTLCKEIQSKIIILAKIFIFHNYQSIQILLIIFKKIKQF